MDILVDTSDPDVIICFETWLLLAILDSEILPPDYVAFRRDRADCYGGVLIAIKCNLTQERDDVFCQYECEFVFIKIELMKGKPLEP